MAESILANDDPSFPHAAAAEGERLAERVVALNEWIVRGGFLPEQWQSKEQKLIGDAARAQELFGDDELERYANEHRKEDDDEV